MIFYYYVKFILRRICHAYFTYLSIIDLGDIIGYSDGLFGKNNMI